MRLGSDGRDCVLGRFLTGELGDAIANGFCLRGVVFAGKVMV